jgi:hypothetical protein
MFEVLQRNRFLLKDTISQAVQVTATSDPPAVPELSSELSRGQAFALGESLDPEEQARIQQMSHDCSAMGQDVTGTYRTEDRCTKGDPLVTVDPEAVGGPGTVERIEQWSSLRGDRGPARTLIPLTLDHGL